MLLSKSDRKVLWYRKGWGLVKSLIPWHVVRSEWIFTWPEKTSKTQVVLSPPISLRPSAHVAMSSYLGSWRRFHPFGEFISLHGQMTGVCCQGLCRMCRIFRSIPVMRQSAPWAPGACRIDLGFLFQDFTVLHNIIYKNGFSKGFSRNLLARSKIDNLRLLR